MITHFDSTSCCFYLVFHFLFIEFNSPVHSTGITLKPLSNLFNKKRISLLLLDLVLSPFLSLFFPLCLIHCLLLIISSVFLHQSSLHLIMFIFLYSSFIIFYLSTYFTFKYFIIPHIRFHSLSLFRLFLFTSNLFVLLFFMIVTTNTYCFII